MKNVAAIVCVVGICATVCSAAPPAKGPTDLLIHQAYDAVAAGNLAQLQPQIEDQMQTMLAKLRGPDPAKLAIAESVREFIKFFGPLSDQSSDEQKATLQWLLMQPNLFPELMSAVDKANRAAPVLSLLTSLHAKYGAKLEDFADLTTSLLVVWDKPSSGTTGPTSADQAAMLFQYFTTARTQWHFNPKMVPWQLAVYAVDVWISPQEIQWAVNRYTGRSPISAAYFDVPYDDAAYRLGNDKQIANHDYTLQNLVQFGGICVDQAYFGTQVAKALFVPSCVCSGRSGAGEVSHAWMGFLDQSGGRVHWNFTEGRYPEDLFWSASIPDPQTGKILNDADVGLLAELQFTTPAARLQSIMLVKSSDLVDPANREKLLDRAVMLSAGNRAAWEGLAALSSQGDLTPAQSNALADTVRRSVAQPFPDFACELLTKMMDGQPVPAQVNTLNGIAQQFSARPDLVAAIRIRQGDLLHQNQQDDNALSAYTNVLTQESKAGPNLLVALARIDSLLRAHNNLAGLVRIYDQVWKSMPQPQFSAYLDTTPFFQIGKRYADLLKEVGDQRDADAVLARLRSMMPPSAKPIE